MFSSPSYPVLSFVGFVVVKTVICPPNPTDQIPANLMCQLFKFASMVAASLNEAIHAVFGFLSLVLGSLALVLDVITASIQRPWPDMVRDVVAALIQRPWLTLGQNVVTAPAHHTNSANPLPVQSPTPSSIVLPPRVPSPIPEPSSTATNVTNSPPLSPPPSPPLPDDESDQRTQLQGFGDQFLDPLGPTMDTLDL